MRIHSGTYYTSTNLMVHSNIQSSGVNLEKAVIRSGPHTDTLCTARCTAARNALLLLRQP